MDHVWHQTKRHPFCSKLPKSSNTVCIKPKSPLFSCPKSLTVVVKCRTSSSSSAAALQRKQKCSAFVVIDEFCSHVGKVNHMDSQKYLFIFIYFPSTSKTILFMFPSFAPSMFPPLRDTALHHISANAIVAFCENI